ncbi:hypothetical protein IFM89_007875, partial [Coptis chinensis]
MEKKGHSNSITSLAFSADGKLLASGSFDGLVQVWDACSGSHKLMGYGFTIHLIVKLLKIYSVGYSVPTLRSLQSWKDLNLFGTGGGEIDFEESETVGKNVMEVLLESPSSNSTEPNIANAPEDSSFLKFFNTATSITNASNAANPGQYQPPAVIPPSFRSRNVPTTVPALELPYAPSPRSGPSLPFPNFSETSIISNHVTNLVKPSVFLMQPPLSTYMIPSTSSSTSTTPINGLGITRDKVRDTLMRLVQIEDLWMNDNQIASPDGLDLALLAVQEINSQASTLEHNPCIYLPGLHTECE